MRAFEVSLNGLKLCLAGVGDDGVLTAIISWATGKGRDELFLEVGGLISSTHEHVTWEREKPLHVNDIVTVKIIDAESLDTPRERKRTDAAQSLEAKKRYVREMAKEFGWTIQGND